jgi:hypothetical protein
MGTVNVLVDPIYRARSILYFRSKTTRELKHPAFVEWPGKHSIASAPQTRKFISIFANF